MRIYISRRLIFLVVISIIGWGFPGLKAQNYIFNHGPYLQGLTENEAWVYFTTSDKGFSYVQVQDHATGEIMDNYTVDNGLRQAYNTRNAVQITGLYPAKEYSYRLVSKQITDFQPYKVTFGDSICSPWYKFSTYDPNSKNCGFVVMSDIHDDSTKYRELLLHLPTNEYDAVFLLGDIMNYFAREGQPYTSFIDTSVDMFARNTPFAVVRGNHETRGNKAREYGDFIHRPDGRYYGIYNIGDTSIIMLDSGEDKPDTHPVYAGLVDFDNYRFEQAQWLKTAVKSERFQNAQYRIIMMHIPPVAPRGERGGPADEEHGAKEVGRLFMPILNEENINFMVCGHTHRHYMVEKEELGNNFPIVILNNKSAAKVNCGDGAINFEIIDTEGNTTLVKQF